MQCVDSLSKEGSIHNRDPLSGQLHHKQLGSQSSFQLQLHHYISGIFMGDLCEIFAQAAMTAFLTCCVSSQKVMRNDLPKNERKDKKRAKKEIFDH